MEEPDPHPSPPGAPRGRLRGRWKRVRDVVRTFRLLSDWRSRARLARIKLDGRLPAGLRRPADPVPLRCKALGGAPLWVRPRATDPEMILWDYGYDFSLPPHELRDDDLRRMVEVGCNTGTGLAGFAARYPDAAILGVEGDPENAALARRNVAGFGERCEVVEAVVWSHPCELTFEGASEWALAAREVLPADPPELPRVSATTLDAVLATHMPDGLIDYLNLSMEGGEPQVLTGSPEWPRRVRSLRVEVQPERGFPLAQALEMMGRLGYETRLQPVDQGVTVFGLSSPG